MWQTTCSCLHFLDHFMHECNLYKAIIKNVKFPINHNIIPDNFLFFILFAYDMMVSMRTASRLSTFTIKYKPIHTHMRLWMKIYALSVLGILFRLKQHLDSSFVYYTVTYMCVLYVTKNPVSNDYGVQLTQLYDNFMQNYETRESQQIFRLDKFT